MNLWVHSRGYFHFCVSLFHDLTYLFLLHFSTTLTSPVYRLFSFLFRFPPPNSSKASGVQPRGYFREVDCAGYWTLVVVVMGGQPQYTSSNDLTSLSPFSLVFSFMTSPHPPYLLPFLLPNIFPQPLLEDCFFPFPPPPTPIYFDDSSYPRELTRFLGYL